MTETIKSVNGIPIRLTPERWTHITEEHSELAGMKYEVLETIHQPRFITIGKTGELLAVNELTDDKYIVVVYKEIQQDGFIITAFITRRIKNLTERQILWQSKD